MLVKRFFWRCAGGDQGRDQIRPCLPDCQTHVLVDIRVVLEGLLHEHDVLEVEA